MPFHPEGPLHYPAGGTMNDEYRVIWEIDITASSPEEAAREAQDYMRDVDTWANVFDVRHPDGTITRVDLDEEEIEHD